MRGFNHKVIIDVGDDGLILMTLYEGLYGNNQIEDIEENYVEEEVKKVVSAVMDMDMKKEVKTTGDGGENLMEMDMETKVEVS